MQMQSTVAEAEQASLTLQVQFACASLCLCFGYLLRHIHKVSPSNLPLTNATVQCIVMMMPYPRYTSLLLSVLLGALHSM